MGPCWWSILCMTLKVKSLGCVRLFVTPWTVASQAPLPMRFSRPECWSGAAISSSRGSSRARDWTGVSCLAGGFFTSWATREGLVCSGVYLSVPPPSPLGAAALSPVSEGLCHLLHECTRAALFLTLRCPPLRAVVWSRDLILHGPLPLPGSVLPRQFCSRILNLRSFHHMSQ